MKATVQKSDWMLIGTCWMALQIILYFYLGINTQEESVKYIALSRSWLHGGGFHWNQVFYSGYIGIHMLLNLAGLPPKSMYLIQLIFSLLAVICFVKTVGLYTSSRLTLLASGILLSTCFFVQQWVTALFTDSLFSSLVTIAVYSLLSEEPSPRKKALTWILVLLLPAFRPAGILVPLLAGIYWFWIGEKRQVLKSLVCVLYLMILGVLVKMSVFNSPLFFYPYHNVEANIICGYPGSLLQYRRVAYDERSGVASYLLANPAMTVRLFSSRFIKVFSMNREYFSPLHNLVLNAFTLVYGFLAVLGSVYLWKQHRRLLIFVILAILIFSVPSVIFCVEWSGRFSIQVYSFILLLSSFGVEQLQGRHAKT